MMTLVSINCNWITNIAKKLKLNYKYSQKAFLIKLALEKPGLIQTKMSLKDHVSFFNQYIFEKSKNVVLLRAKFIKLINN
jgi:hypothetical protein